MISQELEILLHAIFMDCTKKRYESIEVEHLLLGLLDARELATLWKSRNVDVESLRKQTTEAVAKTSIVAEGEVDTQPTLGFQRTIQRAILHVQSRGAAEVKPSDVLVAIFGEKDSPAVQALHQSGLTRLDVVKFARNGAQATHDHSEQSKTSQGDHFLSEEIAKAERVSLNPGPVPEAPAPKLFISYSHVDVSCLDRLLVHLRPLERSKAIACWSDRQIRSGDKWRREIERNLEDAAIAILLVSADFLASDFIVNNELPPLLLRAEARGIRILPVVLKPCGFLRDPILPNFQAINDPSTPLLGLSHIEQEALYNRIADEVAKEVRLRFPAAQGS